MDKKSYSEKLKDPRWQKKRLEIFERDKWVCQKCGSNEETLHVHHLYYERDKEPWEYPRSSLLTLCLDCHEAEREECADAINLFKCIMGFNGCTAGDIWDLCDTIERVFQQIEKPKLLIAVLRKIFCQTGWGKERKRLLDSLQAGINAYEKRQKEK